MELTKSQKRIAILGLFSAWFLIATVIDRYVLRIWAPWFSELLHLENAEIVVRPFSRTFSWLGLSLVLVAPSIAVGLVWSLFTRIKNQASWKTCGGIAGLVSFWFFLIPIFVWLGECVYRFLKGFLDDWAWAKGIVEFVDGFTLKGDIHVYSFKIMHIESGLGAMVGLVVGVIMLYKKGLWKTIVGKAMPNSP